jgi:Lrp/AsnC family transcriptional regulator, regulator for asnA, asnC and gidA
MTQSVELDKTDIHIVNSLSRDGRRSFTDIAQEMDVSVGMVRNRYRRLVDEGILHIIGWTDPAKNGMNTYSRILLKIRPTSLIRDVADQVAQIREVSFVAITTGTHDLEINVTCRNNKKLLQLMQEQIHSIEGVYESSTTMYLEIIKWASHIISAPGDGEAEKHGISGNISQ